MTYKSSFYLVLLLLSLAACGDVVRDPGDGASGSPTGPSPTGGGGAGAGGEGGGAFSWTPGCGDTSGLAPAPWPMEAYCPTRHGRSPLEGPAGPVEIRSSAVPGSPAGVAVAADGSLVVGAYQDGGGVYALTADGEIAWTVGLGAVNGTAALGADGLVYSANEHGQLLAIDGGELVWAFEANAPIWWSSPVIGRDGTIYVGSLVDDLIAVDATGVEKWRLTAGGAVSSPAIGVNGTVYASSYDGKLYAVEPSGFELWTFAADGPAHPPSVSVDGIIYVAGELSLYALLPDGSVLWEVPLPGDFAMGQAIGADGTVYVATAGGLMAVSAGAGILWTFPGSMSAVPTIDAAGTIYAVEGGHTLHALAPEGTELWAVDFDRTAAIGGSVIVGPDRTLHVADAHGAIHHVGQPNE